MRPIATDVARSVVCLSVCWAHGWAVRKQLNWLRWRLGAELCGSKEPCFTWGRDWTNIFATALGYKLVTLDTRFMWYCVLGRLFDRVDLIKPVSNVRPCVCMYVCPCVHKKSFFDFNDIWHVGRGRWVMHDGMQYDPRSRSRALQSRKLGGFQKLSPPPFTMGAGNWPRILKLGHNI